ncbi:MAG: hypothetical protein CM15mP51_16970 [Porticoccaceae bacterium]|nr:MAG: hypothetical protein CM15mP51_16970 [Porticoccaceae bacterium]
MVFQDFALFPHLNVEANVGFGLANLSPKTKIKNQRNAQIGRFEKISKDIPMNYPVVNNKELRSHALWLLNRASSC